MIKFSKSHQGFTLIEILLATSILVMVGVAAIGVERQFMGSAGVNKHKLQATALAQEGISAARKIFNDNILLTSNPALPANPNQTYYLNLTNNQIEECPTASNNCDKNTSGAWNITLNGVTFTRTIKVPAP